MRTRATLNGLYLLLNYGQNGRVIQLKNQIWNRDELSEQFYQRNQIVKVKILHTIGHKCVETLIQDMFLEIMLDLVIFQANEGQERSKKFADQDVLFVDLFALQIK
jgi:hypothetical protein